MENKLEVARKAYDSANYKEAINILISLNLDENGEACYLLGLCYEEFYDVDEEVSDDFVSWNDCDYRTALELFQRGDELGHHEATFRLALQEKENNKDKHNEKSIQLLKKAADLGNSHACYELYVTWHYSNVLDEYINGMLYLEKAVELDNPFAIKALVNKYLCGDGVQYSIKKAYDTYIRILNTTHRTYILDLGLMLLMGDRFNNDYITAYKCFKRLIDIKSSTGYLYLGYMYEFGLGVAKDIKKAIKCYTLYERENTGMFATYQLAMIYSSKEYENISLAKNCFNRLVDNAFFSYWFTDSTMDPDEYDEYADYCNYNLFKLYSIENKDVAKVLKSDITIYKPNSKFRIAKYKKECFNKCYSLYLLKDYKSSCYNLAKMFEKGYPVINNDVYFEMISNGANANDPRCINLLGKYYIDTNPKKAFEIYKKGVDLLDPDCMVEYANMLISGEGCRKNIDTGNIYLKLANEFRKKENGDAK